MFKEFIFNRLLICKEIMQVNNSYESEYYSILSLIFKIVSRACITRFN